MWALLNWSFCIKNWYLYGFYAHFIEYMSKVILALLHNWVSARAWKWCWNRVQWKMNMCKVRLCETFLWRVHAIIVDYHSWLPKTMLCVHEQKWEWLVTCAVCIIINVCSLKHWWFDVDFLALTIHVNPQRRVKCICSISPTLIQSVITKSSILYSISSAIHMKRITIMVPLSWWSTRIWITAI